MAMKLVKKTAEYSIYARGDNRYAVKGADKKPVNGEEKVKILLAEGLIKVSEPSEPAEPEAAVEEDAAADEAPEETAEEAASEEEAEEAKDGE